VLTFGSLPTSETSDRPHLGVRFIPRTGASMVQSQQSSSDYTFYKLSAEYAYISLCAKLMTAKSITQNLSKYHSIFTSALVSEFESFPLSINLPSEKRQVFYDCLSLVERPDMTAPSVFVENSCSSLRPVSAHERSGRPAAKTGRAGR